MLYSRQQNPNDNRCHGKPTASLNFIRENGSSVPGIGSTSAPPLKTTLQLSGESVNSAIICGQKRASFCIPASLNASYVHSSSTSIAMLVPDIDFPLDHRLAVTLLFYIIKCNMACHSLCHVRAGHATNYTSLRLGDHLFDSFHKHYLEQLSAAECHLVQRKRLIIIEKTCLLVQ